MSSSGEQHPASCRNLFYRLVQDGLVDKTEGAYKTLIKHLVNMRRSGDIPYPWLTDATRQGHHVYTWRDPEKLAARRIRLLPLGMWAGDHLSGVVWCESASLTNVLMAGVPRVGR